MSMLLPREPLNICPKRSAANQFSPLSDTLAVVIDELPAPSPWAYRVKRVAVRSMAFARAFF
jgi:hypothetical protein